MANVVNIDLNVTANGLAAANKEAKEFADNTARASREAKGYQILSRTNTAPGESKTARSIGKKAGTGSAASDFAAQAAGLGGLVHLYATFAANIYAVSTAWSALSKAMDTTNLVKGLDQIGASTGKNLGSLAKQMITVADSAISMQQAMQSVALASSGGMSNSQILRMTQVAKNASLALGRDLPDSMDRLTKGIVKTQPELLDELGIMTRVIPAQQKYAEQIGKTVDSLTDFEKHQAFTNAVLAEGESKFGAISLDTNPYSKVLASIKNLMQSGLELINKVLGPLLGMLASSPTGLATVLAGISALLIKQAVPAFGRIRENARLLEDDTRAKLRKRIDEQVSAAGMSDAEAGEEAVKKFRTTSLASKLVEKDPKRFNKEILGQEVRDIVRKSPYDITEKEKALIIAKHAELGERITKLFNDSEKLALSKERERLDTKLHYIKIAAQAESDIWHDAAAKREASESKFGHAAQQQRILDKLHTQLSTRNVLTSAADDAATMGPVYAYNKMRENIKEENLTGITKIGTTIRGTMSIATTAIGTAINAFSVWGQAAALAGVGIGILDTHLSTSAKEAEAYSSSIDTLNSSFGNVQRTIDTISKKKPLEQLSIESTQAKANALNDLAESFSGVVLSFNKLKKAQSGWDKFKDGFLSEFGVGDGDKLATNVSETIVESLRAMEEGPAKEQAKKTYKKIISEATGSNTRVDLNSIKEIKNTIKDLGEDKLAKISEDSDKYIKNIALNTNNAAASLTAFKTALADVSKEALVSTNKLIPTDDISHMGIALGKAGKALADSSKDTEDYIKALQELSKNTSALTYIGTDADKLRASVSSMEAYMLRLKQAKEELSKSTDAIDKATEDSKDPKNKAKKYRGEYRKIIDVETERANILRKSIKEDTEHLNNIKETYKGIPKALAEASFERLTKGLKNAIAQADLNTQKGLVGLASQAGANMDVDNANLTLKDLGIKAELIKSNVRLALSTEKLNATSAYLALVTERASIEASIHDQTMLARQGVDTKDKLQELGGRLAQNIKNTPDAIERVRITSEASNSNTLPKVTAKLNTLLPSLSAELMGAQAQLATIAGEAVVAETNKKIATTNYPLKEAKELNNTELERLAIKKKELDSIKLSEGYYSDELESAKLYNTMVSEALTYANKQIDADIRLNSLYAARDALLKSKDKNKDKSIADINAGIKQIEKYKQVNTEQYDTNQNLTASAKAYSEGLAEITRKYNDQIHALDILKTVKTSDEDADAIILKAKQDNMALSDAEIAKNAKIAADKKADLTLEMTNLQTILELHNNIDKIKLSTKLTPEQVADEIAAAGKAANYKIEKATADNEAAKKSSSAILEAANINIAAKSNWTEGAKNALRDYNNEITNVAANIKNVMTSAFKGAEDALTNFVMTGKLDFKSLVDSVIAGLVRIKIQESIMPGLSEGLDKGISSIFNLFKADGGAFDRGIEKFAKGGSFTNSIVSEPTAFRFAKGIGLMGEAGPEAIMPLSRDSKGTLGVRTMGNNAPQIQNTITINIVESKEKAGTQERTTENGVDMITVFVEKVKNSIAGDISRGTGSVTGALSRTYGLNRVAGVY
jgi:lambda family phage tail tape measure protein